MLSKEEFIVKLKEVIGISTETAPITETQTQPTPDIPATKFMNANTADGKVISNNKETEFAVGDKLYTADNVELQDGDIVLENGVTITITGGVISNITAAKPAEQTAVLEQAQFAKQTEITELKAKLSELEIKLSSMTDANDKLTKLVDIISKEPASKPIVRTAEPEQTNSRDKLKSFVNPDLLRKYESLQKNKN